MLPDDCEYWGDQPYPADLWGKAPIRGQAVRVVHEFLAETDLDWIERPGEAATQVVHALIEAGILPDELPGTHTQMGCTTGDRSNRP